MGCTSGITRKVFIVCLKCYAGFRVEALGKRRESQSVRPFKQSMCIPDAIHGWLLYPAPDETGSRYRTPFLSFVLISSFHLRIGLSADLSSWLLKTLTHFSYLLCYM
jgi:hypothetical protein